MYVAQSAAKNQAEHLNSAFWFTLFNTLYTIQVEMNILAQRGSESGSDCLCLKHSQHMASLHKTAASISVQKLNCCTNGECGTASWFNSFK